MTYKVMLLLHVIGVVTLFGAITVEQAVGARLRRANTFEEVRGWVGLLESTSKLFPISSVVILATGGYMTHLAWTFSTAWIVVSIALLVIAAVLGGAVIGRRLGILGERCATGTGTLPPELLGALAAPAIWIASLTEVGLGLSFLFEMTIKPDWTEAIGVPVIAIVVFAALGAQIARGASAPAAAAR
jgi:hypothetical protein